MLLWLADGVLLSVAKVPGRTANNSGLDTGLFTHLSAVDR